MSEGIQLSFLLAGAEDHQREEGGMALPAVGKDQQVRGKGIGLLGRGLCRLIIWYVESSLQMGALRFGGQIGLTGGDLGGTWEIAGKSSEETNPQTMGCAREGLGESNLGSDGRGGISKVSKEGCPLYVKPSTSINIMSCGISKL